MDWQNIDWLAVVGLGSFLFGGVWFTGLACYEYMRLRKRLAEKKCDMQNDANGSEKTTAPIGEFLTSLGIAVFFCVISVPILCAYLFPSVNSMVETIYVSMMQECLYPLMFFFFVAVLAIGLDGAMRVLGLEFRKK